MLRPTWTSGFARNASEAKWPQLWHGRVFGVAPCLGPSGSILTDLSGWSRHGTLTNMDPATDWIVSENAYALDFDGTDDYITFGDADDFSIRSYGFTVSAWVKWPSAAPVVNGGLMSKRTSFGSNDEWNLLYRGDSNEGGHIGFQCVAFRIASNPGVAAYDLSPEANRWYHIAARCTGAGFAEVLVDGVLGGTSGTVTPSAGTASSLVAGCLNAASTLHTGQLDDMAIYQRRLTDQEIRLLSRRRGLAYELAERRRAYSIPADAPVTRRRQMLHCL